MTLKDHLLGRIAQNGPLSISDYMGECLLHPQLGYYATRDPLGKSGDFTTAPEISQMFGELIGLSLAQSWVDQGRPARFTLAEAGPGRGTLMKDILRATRAVPGFVQAANITLIEASPFLQNIQRETLQEYAPDWIGSVDALPPMPLFFVANEFFDALPIRQFIRDGKHWRERCVGADNTTLQFGLSPPLAPPELVHRLADTKDGDLVEICPAATSIAAQIGQIIEARSGCALIIDYGDWRSQGDTLQAVKNHGFVDPLETPGDADLTAHVDFEALCRAVACRHTRLTPQGVFLERLGISQRAQTLLSGAGANTRKDVTLAHKRLTHPSEMGNLFKTIGFYQSNATPPPGLDP